MAARIHHRGPDGTGFHCAGAAGLASARLKIVDLAHGDQPIYNEDRTIAVVFNGEIFNYVELRAELLRLGHTLATESDTEVIVHLYEQYGDAFVDHLNGQFALAIWDSRAERLVLARDRVGIRPLFYTVQNGRLLFASEIKSLFAHDAVPRRIDTNALTELFTYWSPLEPHTVFEGIQSLPPGHLLIAHHAQLDVRRYWDWSFPAEPIRTVRSDEWYAEELRALLIDAVRIQLRADVPVGAYLSGGLDSAAIAALVKSISVAPLRTFSIRFEDAEFDEGAHQSTMSRFLGTEHTSVTCTRRDIADFFPRTIAHTESPVLRTAPTPLFILSKHVHEAGYKVVLTGEGADEVFGGYDIFKEARVRRMMARWPDSPRGAALLSQLYPWLKHSPGSGGAAFARRFFGEGAEHAGEPFFAHIPRWTTTSRIAQFLSPALREHMASGDAFAAVMRTLPPSIRSWPALAQDQYVEAHTLLSGYLLSSQGDRVAMANSVEGRVPFLDHRVIEFANALPPRLKLRGLTEKYILRKALSADLPDEVRTRTKQPYRAPDSDSFVVDGKLVPWAAELLSEDRLREGGYFDPMAVRKLADKCRAGRTIGFGDNMAFVGILSTMLVDEMFVRGRSVNPATGSG